MVVTPCDGGWALRAMVEMIINLPDHPSYVSGQLIECDVYSIFRPPIVYMRLYRSAVLC